MLRRQRTITARRLRRDAADVAWSVELAGLGYRIIRFRDNEVMGNIGGVLQVVLRTLEESPTSP
jgi:very-short-patch-repair endonuclease